MITKRYLAIRSLYAIATSFVAIVLNFLLPRLTPGNPAVTALVTTYHYLPPGKLKLLEAQFGLTNAPLYVQFETYFVNLLHGNLGFSFHYYPQTVVQVIAEHLPWTLFLLGTATLISSFLGVVIGRIVGWKSGTRGETVTSSIFIGLTSLPYFWFAIILQLLLAVDLVIRIGTTSFHIFPINGSYSIFLNPGFTPQFIYSALRHSALPLISIVVTAFPGFALTMRNTMVNLNKEDYITMAKAKGLHEYDIVKKYAGRNAVLPVSTHIVLAFGYIVAGAFFVEIVFGYQGIGYVLYEAVTSQDFPLTDGIFLVITFTVIIANFVADLLYAYLDPRVQLR